MIRVWYSPWISDNFVPNAVDTLLSPGAGEFFVCLCASRCGAQMKLRKDAHHRPGVVMFGNLAWHISWYILTTTACLAPNSSVSVSSDGCRWMLTSTRNQPSQPLQQRHEYGDEKAEQPVWDGECGWPDVALIANPTIDWWLVGNSLLFLRVKQCTLCCIVRSKTCVCLCQSFWTSKIYATMPFSRMRSKGSRFTLGVWGLRVCSLDVAFASATVRNRPYELRMAVPMGSFAEVVLFGGFRRLVASFRVAGVALRDIQTCSATCRKSFCVAGAILLRRFQKMCCSFRGRRSTLDVSIVIFRGRRSTLDVSRCVFFANCIGRAALNGGKVQIPWQAWHLVTCAENWRKPRTKHRFWGCKLSCSKENS